MALKRIVDTRFWTDDKVVEQFTPEDKLFMLYLLTNPHTTQLGVYAINKKVMAFELGFSLDTINVLIDRFENKYKMIRYSANTNEIAIKNYLKYSIIKGGKPVEDCLDKEIQQVKDKSLLSYIFNNSYTNISINNIINKYYIYNDNDNEVSYNDTYSDTCNDTKEKRFKKPTLEEVQEYCKERNNGVDAQKFINFYESKGWYVGKNKMKDWKACVRTWERKNNQELPQWFDRKIETQQMTEQEQEELDNLLKDF